MTSPLSPAPESVVNMTTPPQTKRYEEYEVQAYSVTSNCTESYRESPPHTSSAVNNNHRNQENMSPSKSRHSRVLSGNELSPLKILTAPRDAPASVPVDGAPLLSARSPRKMSPEKRFPVRITSPSETTQGAGVQAMDLDDAIRQNRGLKRAIDIFEDEESMMDTSDTASPTATVTIDPAPADEEEEELAGPDDTMISTFSTFSAVPSMTMFAKIGQDNTGFLPVGGPSPSRTPRPAQQQDSSNTTNLLDFTEQLRHPQRSPSKRGNKSPSRPPTTTNMTPARQLASLIDFDIPPMPTPRSVPTVTPRELESLKSSFLSEISSLKASLSGKEAEVQSLKSAVGDAEKRVGESMEQLREERATKDQLAAEKEDWEKRGREMENVLRKVKDEIVLGQKEREQLEQRLEESEKRREAAEMMHQEAESKMAGMRAGKESEKSTPEGAKSPGSSSSRDVEIAVERVARELHGLYKSKHETKVAALKKSYEARWEKKVRELEVQIEELGDENERLRVGRDVTMTKVDPNSAEMEERKAQAARDSAAIKELNADIQRLEAVVSTVQKDNEELRGLLERERVEKGELVQLAEEMMNMQSFVAPTPAAKTSSPRKQQQQQQQQGERAEGPRMPPKMPSDNPRSTANRGSGLKAPSGLRAPHERTKSGGGGLPRPGGVHRSGIMNSIEKMGSYRGRAAE
ncbi:hypothetical protein S7711_04625 [Stachybotrys chartarum IBT 7711]|uniref:Kinetoplast-associated protein KAP n=1 Tax=Stachybotrys chartarum (strain CBS 109288 / IBT 7711) TaxID=1280523 RepID=A0A084AUI1_STACB|nr:hypothetical protein S7711_04625 [Stachybotrys chartarum IBT 7711]KFA52096.1 hypothetical protein S40293_02975 [Stachybotrys chartarum IBT 40293]